MDNIYNIGKRDIVSLPNYIKHVEHMTSESLHSKSDIAAELAYRDNRIKDLEDEIEDIRKYGWGNDQ